MNAQTVLQWKIEAEQLLDDITYGIRSLQLCGSTHTCVGIHAGQVHRAAAAAGLFLDREANTILYAQGGHGTLALLREAKKIAAETLKETKAAAKDFGYGTARQLKLGLAVAGDTHEYALGA